MKKTMTISGSCSFRFRTVVRNAAEMEERFQKDYAKVVAKKEAGYKLEGNDKFMLATNGNFEEAFKIAYRMAIREMLSEEAANYFGSSEIGKGSVKVTFDERNSVSD